MRSISPAWRIFIGMILGVALGGVFHGNTEFQAILKPLGDIFIRLIRAIVIPIVISSLVVGIAGTGDIKKVGKLGVKTLVYFEIITTLAIFVGLLFANVLRPGTGISLKNLQHADINSYVDTAETVSHHGFVETLVNIVPNNIFAALAKGDMLAIVFFSVLLGLGIAIIGEKGNAAISFFRSVSAAMFALTNEIMRLAPIGVFALIGGTVSHFGLSALMPLSRLVLVCYLAMIVFSLVVLGGVARMFGLNIIALIRFLKDELILAFSTASSETVLPKLIEKAEAQGCSRGTASFVIPAGYSFNLDGSTLYQAIATLFIAQLYQIDMSLSQQLYVLFVLMITSKGIAGVPGVSFVVLLATLGGVGLPVEGLAFIVGIDRLLDMGRTAVNVLGNSLAALIIGKLEGEPIVVRLTAPTRNQI